MGTTFKIYLPWLEAEESSLKPETEFKGQVNLFDMGRKNPSSDLQNVHPL